MSKLSFRARALDATKPMPIYMAEELPDLPDYSAINRAVPQMPSGMNKEEECEHHLQRAICAGLIIPTPEVADIPDKDFYDLMYPANYKQPRQLIHMQPFTMEQDIPDYDMDSEDERWLQSQAQRLELDPLKFEEMMDRLEKSSGQTVVTLNEAKALLKEDDDLIIAVFDYWLNKRLKTQHPLILTVKTEQRAGTATNSPYLAFRRRTEKMQTRKNRKNDEASYEKMLKLRRDLHRAVTLLELVKKREKMKREHVHLTVEIYEKRYQARDFSGAIYAEAAAIKTRPAFTPIFHNHYTNQSWTNNKAIMKDDAIQRKEKRQYKKRKHKSLGHLRGVVDGGIGGSGGVVGGAGSVSSDDERASQLSPEPEEAEDEGQFAFRRNKLCSYHMPLPEEGNWPWSSAAEHGWADKRFRFTLTSVSHPRRRCIGFGRRRMGRGGRVILDRIATEHDDLWRTLDFSIIEPAAPRRTATTMAEHTHDLIDVKSEVSEPLSSTVDVVSSSIVNNNSELGSSEYAMRTDLIKREYGDEYEPNRTSSDITATKSDIVYSSGFSDNVQQTTMSVVRPVVSVEQTDGGEEEDDMVEVLRSVRRDWLHFRPKTPPPDWEPPCDMQPLSESYYVPGDPSPFSIEIQSFLSEPPSASLLDSGIFLTDPFNLDEAAQNEDLISDVEQEVPIVDTRQQRSSDKLVQTTTNNALASIVSNTLTSSVNSISSNYCAPLNDYDCNVGCSKFHLYDSSRATGCLDSATKQSETSRTEGAAVAVTVLTTKHHNNSNHCTKPGTVTTLIQQKNNVVNEQILTVAHTAATANTNGLLTSQIAGVKNNKVGSAYHHHHHHVHHHHHHHNAYGSSAGTLSLHTSARALTLNSHSANNILEIPLAADGEPVEPTKLMSNTSETVGGGVTVGGGGGVGTVAPSNNKNNNKMAAVRKNNIVMEVT